MIIRSTEATKNILKWKNQLKKLDVKAKCSQTY